MGAIYGGYVDIYGGGGGGGAFHHSPLSKMPIFYVSSLT